MTSFLAQQLLADITAAPGSTAFAEQELMLLHSVMKATAVAAAVPAVGWQASAAAEAVIECLAIVLQVCDAGADRQASGV